MVISMELDLGESFSLAANFTALCESLLLLLLSHFIYCVYTAYESQISYSSSRTSKISMKSVLWSPELSFLYIVFLKVLLKASFVPKCFIYFDVNIHHGES